jgi:hypothetical protein
MGKCGIFDLLHNGVIGVLTGLTKMLSRCSYWAIRELAVGNVLWDSTNLVARLAIEQDPSQLDYFGRVLSHIYTVLIAGSSHVNDDVTVEFGSSRSGSLGGHIVQCFRQVETDLSTGRLAGG